MQKEKLIKKILLIGFLVFIPLSIAIPQDSAIKKVIFLPSWVPQPQFAGYYMAKEKGIYRKYGLDVTILPGGHDRDVTASLKSGEIDFGIMFLYTGVMERSKGTKLVNIGQIFQRSGIMFIAKKKSGITSLKDFNGKKIGVWRTICTELTSGFLKKNNIHAEVIPFDKGINIFLKDAVDVTVMMNYNEYKRMLNAGINPGEVNKFSFADYDMDFPEDGIYCMESTYKNNPELCKKFVDASVEGWNYALANPDETIAVINRYQEKQNVSHNKSHSLWMLNSMKDIIGWQGKNAREGKLLEQDFNHLTDFLYKNNFISGKPLYTDFYKGGM